MPREAQKITLSVLLLAFFFISPTCANDVRLLCDDHLALDARVKLIKTCEKNLDIAWFEFDDDAIGQHLCLAVADAAKRGVSVRLVLDGMFDRSSTHQRELLKTSGVKIKWFHPTGTGATNLMQRMHDKYLAADQKQLIVGSRNISNVYFGRSEVEPNFVDYDILVSGEFVEFTKEYFDSLWDSEEVDSHRTHKPSAKLLHHSSRKIDAPLDIGVPTAATPQRFDIATDKMSFLYDASATKDPANGIHNDLYKLIQQASEQIDIVAPYFFPSRDCVSVLKKAEQRGVRIRILTNSLESTNRPINHVALMTQMRHRLGTLPIYQYAGDRTLHAKGLVVDQKIACVTSYNFNRRSEFFDTELALTINDEAFAAALSEQFATYFARSSRLPVTPRRNLGTGTEYQPEEIRQLRWLARLIPNHL